MKYLTAKEIAEKFQIKKRAAQTWCERGLFPNAKKIDSGFGFEVWQVPESDLVDFKPPKMGRPHKKT